MNEAICMGGKHEEPCPFRLQCKRHLDFIKDPVLAKKGRINPYDCELMNYRFYIKTEQK